MRLHPVLLWDVRLLLPALVLLTSACDESPGIDAVGIQRGLGGKIGPFRHAAAFASRLNQQSASRYR